MPSEASEDVALYDSRMADLAAGKDSLLPEGVSRLLLRNNTHLKAIRLRRGLSQTELAKQAGIGQGYLSDMESGRRPVSGEVLASLAAKLDVPPQWIA